MIAGEDLQFGPGLSQHNVSIHIVNDSHVETTELFSALLTTTTAGVTLAPRESLIYILDNGNCLLCYSPEICYIISTSLLLDVLIGFEHVNYSVSETVGQFKINITVLDGILTHPISVVLSTSDGTAIGKYWIFVAQIPVIGCLCYV